MMIYDCRCYTLNLLIDCTSFMYEASTLAEGANCKLLASKDVWEDDV